MAKVIIKDLAKSLPKRSRISEKRVVNREGKVVAIPTVDSNSPHFSSDLHRLFQRNVAKARRENKRRFGSPDRVSEKA
ncbi:MAG TPA: hypothetical protein VFT69_01660 [Pseudolabrys sp.]|nr:hypothetical protein [Pseudolabrys sp.]